ncbi:diguanylate cyclase [soil metagenome]
METESLTILIADDSPTVRASLAVTLARLGHKPILAEGGRAAIKAYEKQKPDLVLIDVAMPDADGYEVARAMREGDPGEWVPIVFLAAPTDDASLERGIEAGGDDYLVKPVSKVMLAAKLRAMARVSAMRRRLIVLSSELLAVNRQMANAAGEDALTRLGNKRAFDMRLAQEIARGRRSREALTLMFIEVDYFKRYADYFGAAQADECLRQVASALRGSCRRAADFVARMDEERFALVLPSTHPQGSVMLGTVLQRAIETLALHHPRSELAQRVTVSGGIATCVPSEQTTNEALVLRAEEALFTAKEQGRNRFFSYEAQAEPDGHGMMVQTVPAIRNMTAHFDLMTKERRAASLLVHQADIATVPPLV